MGTADSADYTDSESVWIVKSVDQKSAESVVFLRLPIDVVANLERVTDAVDPRNGLQDHFYDIEPVIDTGVIEHSQPFFSATDNPFLFS